MVKQYGFYVDTNLCTSCKCCVAACKDKNDSPVKTKYRRVVDVAGGTWNVDGKVCAQNNVFVYSLSYSCMHCAHPACVEACSTGAMTKRDDGIVFVNQDECIGCGMCKTACPYDAPRLDETHGVMGKCDFCRDYIDQNKNPACVDACQMRCLKLGEVAELRAEYGSNADLYPLASSEQTDPSIVLKTNGLAVCEGEVINPAEEIA